MKIRMLAAVAAAMAMMGAGGAFAQSATQNINLSATVAGFCTIDGLASGATRSGTVPASSIVNGQATSASVSIGSDSPAVCNTNTLIQIKSQKNGLTSATAASGSFTNKIHYTATATFNGATDTYNTATPSASAGVFDTGTSTTSGAASGNLAIAVTTQSTTAGSYLVAATDYSDVLTVQLTPQ